MKACSFFGYRDFKPTEEMEAKVYEIIENLIDKGVNRFLFGSRSDFDTFCHSVVTRLQEKYPNIVRVSYLCLHERSCLIGEGKDEEEWLKRFAKIDINVKEYEEIKRSDRINSAGRASYIERNQWMIDDSDVVVVYVKETSNKISGSALALKYAKTKHKNLIIV